MMSVLKVDVRKSRYIVQTSLPRMDYRARIRAGRRAPYWGTKRSRLYGH